MTPLASCGGAVFLYRDRSTAYAESVYLRSEFCNYTMLKKISVSEMQRYVSWDAPNTEQYLVEASLHPPSVLSYQSSGLPCLLVPSRALSEQRSLQSSAFFPFLGKQFVQELVNRWGNAGSTKQQCITEHCRDLVPGRSDPWKRATWRQLPAVPRLWSYCQSSGSLETLISAPPETKAGRTKCSSAFLGSCS